MNRITLFLFFVLCALANTAAAEGIDTGAVVGGGVGGAIGAAVGSEVGGRTGAVVGGAIGAATGVAIATHESEEGSGSSAGEAVSVEAPPKVVYVESSSRVGHPRHRQHPGLALGHYKHKHKGKFK